MSPKAFLCLGVLFFQLTIAAHAQDATLRMAIVTSPEIDQLGLAEPITAELAKVPKFELVDRANIDRIRNELDLATLCKPESIKRRQALGKTLGADLLFVLKATHEGKSGHQERTTPMGHRLHLVLVDCRYGVRLVDTLLFFDKEKSIEAVRDRIVTTCKKYAGGVRHIIGMTPMVSKTVYGRMEPLHSGLRRLIEKLLTQETDFTVLAPKECLLIERERQLGTIPNTSVSITILKGSYAVEVKPGIRPRVNLIFEATRNGKVVAQKTFTLRDANLQSLHLSGDTVNQILVFVQETLDASTKIQCSPEELDATAEELLRQIELQAELVDLIQVCNLAEALLLIKPDCTAARLYALGGYHRRCQRLPRIRDRGKLRTDVALFLHRTLDRWLDHTEYLIRNEQISVERASRLYYTLGFDCSKSNAIRHDSRSFYVGGLPDSDPVGTSCQKLLEHYIHSVLPMLRRCVKTLPTENDPSLNEVFDYCIAPTDIRTSLEIQDFIKRNRARRKRVAPNAMKYWPPDSRESQITCWQICSISLMTPIHEMISQCYASCTEEYETAARELLALEEDCILAYLPKGLSCLMAERYLAGMTSQDIYEKRTPMMQVSEMTEHYKAMFDRLAKDNDPAVQISGMVGSYALRRCKERTITQLKNERVSIDEMASLNETIKFLEEICKHTSKFEQNEPPKMMDFDWVVPGMSIRYKTKGINSYCKWKLQHLKKLAREAPLLKPGEEVLDEAMFQRAKIKFNDLARKTSYGHVPEELRKKDPLKIAGRPIRPETHLAKGQTSAYYSPLPNVDTKKWITLLKLDKRTDLIVTPTRLIRMRKHGQPEMIFNLATPEGVSENKKQFPRASQYLCGAIKSVLYDGTYLWVTSTKRGVYALTRDGKLLGNIYNTPGFPFSTVMRQKRDGFSPVMYTTIEAPGKILLVMQTKTSTIIGRMKIDASKRLVFEPLHLASKTPVKQSVEEFMSPDAPFRPEPWMHLFKYDDKQQWLAVPRTMSYNSHKTHSTLWVNIKDPSDVRVDKQQLKCFPALRSLNSQCLFDLTPLSISGNRTLAFQHGNHRFSWNRPLNLCVVTPPKPEAIGTVPASFKKLADPQDGGDLNCGKAYFVTQDDEYIFMAYPGTKFARINKDTLQVECWPLLSDAEGPAGLLHFASARYGIVALDQDRLYQLKLDEKGPKLSNYFSKVPSQYVKRHARAMERLVEAGAYVVPWEDDPKGRVYHHPNSKKPAPKGGGCSVRIDRKTKDIREVCHVLPDVYSFKMLILDQAELVEEDFASLARCSIEKLVLDFPPDRTGRSPLNDKALAWVLKNESIKQLYIKGNGLTDDAFATIKNAKQLQTLELLSDRFSGKALSDIAKAPALKRLKFQGPKFTDQGMLELGEANRWIDLFFARTQITPNGLAKLYSRWKENQSR